MLTTFPMLFHRDLGGAGLPPLVILPGFLGSSRNWQTAGRELTTRYHVLALDLLRLALDARATGKGDVSTTMMLGAADVISWTVNEVRRAAA